MSANFNDDHNRLFNALENALKDRTELKQEANGGNSILFVYPNEEDNLYVAEAKRRFRNDVIFVDVAEALTDFQEEIGTETFKELEEEIGTAIYYRIDDGKPVEDCFFKFLVDRISSAIDQGLPVFLVNTSAIANKGFSNINIMEYESVKLAPNPLVYFYPSTVEGDKIYFLGDHNHVASQYRCLVIL